MDFTISRDNMVKTQIINRGIKDKQVISAFLKVPRHKFMSKAFQENAYGDYPLPIGYGQTISQPYIVALMTSLLEINPSDKIFEVGTGSGYQTAILAELGNKVFSTERIKELAELARKTIDSLNYQNVNIRVSDGTYGWEEFSPFDKIIVTASAPFIPEPLLNQLASNGKMVIPEGNTFSQVLKLITKKNNKITINEICGCTFVPLIGKYGWEK